MEGEERSIIRCSFSNLLFSIFVNWAKGYGNGRAWVKPVSTDQAQPLSQSISQPVRQSVCLSVNLSLQKGKIESVEKNHTPRSTT